MNRFIATSLVSLALVLIAPIGDTPATQTQKHSPMLLQALARNEAYTKVFDGGARTPTVGKMKLVAKPTGPSRYVCTAISCSCSGSFDCVKMIAADKKCDNSTVGCNDAGCVCTPK